MTKNTDTPFEVTGLNPAEAAAAVGQDAVITDDMSFAEAFAAARAEFGPGASFTWHGQVYGTYYQTEWNAMTPAEQHAFTASAIGDGPVNTPLEVTVDNTDYAAVEPVADDDDAEVRVLGYDSYDEDGQQVNIAALSVNDEPVIMIDLDNDNVYDYAVADFDRSNEIMDTDNDIVDISDYNITADNVAELDTSIGLDDDMMNADDMAIVDGI